MSQGTYTFDNGAIYEGQFDNKGKFCGRGKLYFYKDTKDHYYEGEFKNDKLNGKGFLKLGSFEHEGVWKDDRCVS